MLKSITINYDDYISLLSEPDELAAYIAASMAFIMSPNNSVNIKKKDLVSNLLGEGATSGYITSFVHNLKKIEEKGFITDLKISKYNICFKASCDTLNISKDISIPITTIHEIGKINTKFNKCKLIAIYLVIIKAFSFDKNLHLEKIDLRGKFVAIKYKTIANKIGVSIGSLSQMIDFLERNRFISRFLVDGIYVNEKFIYDPLKKTSVFCLPKDEIYFKDYLTKRAGGEEISFKNSYVDLVTHKDDDKVYDECLINWMNKKEHKNRTNVR